MLIKSKTMRILLVLFVLIQAFLLQASNTDLIKNSGLVSGNGTKTTSFNRNLRINPQLRQIVEHKLATAPDAWLLNPVMPPPPPNWVPVPNLQFNMNVIGKIQISTGVYSVNENDIIGAFVGSECRGVANPYASLGGILFLTIGSNIQSGETVTFKIYFASTNEIINANETIPFQNAGEVGTMASPFIFTFTAPCTLAVTPSNQNVAYSPASSTSFSVTSNCNWTAVSNQTWCTVTPSGSGNGTITANYSINTSNIARTANITVSVSGVSPIVVTVTQAATCTLAVTPSNQNVAYTPAGSTSFSVTSNCNWTAVSNQTWCTVTPSGSGNGTITANYSVNTSTDARTANITVTVSGVSPIVVTVTQAAPCTLAVTPSNQNVAYSPASSTSFSVISNCNWTAVSNQTWCTVTPSGSGNGTITANYSINSSNIARTANITVTVSGATPNVVTITQAALCTLAVTPANQNVPYSPAGTATFSITSNCNWTATSNQTWCTVTPSGSGNGTLTANYSINTTTSVRTANITVTVLGVAPVVVTVTQAPTPIVPTWTPVPNLQFNMNVIGKIQISSGVYSLNENDVIGAFVGNECRGVASPYSFLGGMLFLTIGSNILSGETVTFKIFLASSNEIVNANETFPFQNAGEVGTMSSPFIFTYGTAGNTLTLTLFLEGLINNNVMNKTQSVSGNQFPGTVADVITVELHASTTPFSIVSSAYSVNLNTDGTATTIIPSAYNGSYYIAIKSRNHIETWTSSPISFASSPINVNFSASQNSAYSNNLKIIGNKFCIFAGDLNQDGTVDGFDLTLLSNKAVLFNTGYIPEDLNGDGIVDALDIIMLDNNAANFVAVKKP